MLRRRGSEFLFSLPPPNYLVMQAAKERARQYPPCWLEWNGDVKRLDLLGSKVFSLASLQFHISNYLALLAKYDFLNYGQFADKLPQQDHARFQAILEEGT